MGWMLLLILALAVVLLAIWRVKPDRVAMQILLACLLLAAAGYAWQGRPDYAGRPASAAPRQHVLHLPFAGARKEMMPRFDRAGMWLTMAEGYQGRGDTAGAAQLLRSAIRANPQNINLWLGLGNALLVHGGGRLNPAAELAYARAYRLAPKDNPTVDAFYGLAQFQDGQFGRAAALWQRALAKAPADAQWRPLIERNLMAAERLSAETS